MENDALVTLSFVSKVCYNNSRPLESKKQIHPFRRGGRRRLARITCAALAFLLAAAAFPAAAYAAEGEGESPALLQAAELPEGGDEGDPSEELAPAALREAPFSVTVENEQSPTGELILGSSCQIGGVIRSESVMAKVFGGIYTVSGEKVIYHEVTPNAQSCNIAQSFDAAAISRSRSTRQWRSATFRSVNMSFDWKRRTRKGRP